MKGLQAALLAAVVGVAGLGIGVVGMRTNGGDKSATEQVVHDYILAHPEIIPEAMTRLQSRENAKAIGGLRGPLEKPFASAWAGTASPRVTLVMFTDYACGYCRASFEDVGRLLAENPDLKVVWREIPVLGPQSEVAARVALAAAKQGKYLPMHKGLFAAGRPDNATIASVASGAGLDPGALATTGKGQDITEEIASNLSLAGKVGVTGTPAFVIGDQFLSGAVGYDALAKAVAAARKG